MARGDLRVRAARRLFPSGQHHDFEGSVRPVPRTRAGKRTAVSHAVGRHDCPGALARPSAVATRDRGERLGGDAAADGAVWRAPGFRSRPRMSRTHRASIAAVFAYLQFSLSIVVGIALVPFVLHRVGPRLYGYWLASGEVLAYAAMADFGIMSVVPWLIAEADGRRDRAAIRRLMSTGFCAAIVVSGLYALLVIVLWRAAPSILSLGAADRAAIAGPLQLIAAVTAVVMPLRVFGTVLMGLQDVKFYGILSTANWALNIVLTVTLMLHGYGLYALAIGTVAPSIAGVVAMCVRTRIIAP